MNDLTAHIDLCLVSKLTNACKTGGDNYATLFSNGIQPLCGISVSKFICKVSCCDLSVCGGGFVLLFWIAECLMYSHIPVILINPDFKKRPKSHTQPSPLPYI